jgi:hypothetical protein
MSGSTLSQIQDYWGKPQQALFPYVMGARVLWTGAILRCLFFSFVAESAFAQIAADVAVAKDSSSSSTTIATSSFNTAAAMKSCWLSLHGLQERHKHYGQEHRRRKSHLDPVRRTNAQSGTA